MTKQSFINQSPIRLRNRFLIMFVAEKALSILVIRIFFFVNEIKEKKKPSMACGTKEKGKIFVARGMCSKT